MNEQCYFRHQRASNFVFVPLLFQHDNAPVMFFSHFGVEELDLPTPALGLNGHKSLVSQVTTPGGNPERVEAVIATVQFC